MTDRFTKYPALRILIIMLLVIILAEIIGFCEQILLMCALGCTSAALISIFFKKRFVAFLMLSIAAGLAVSADLAKRSYSIPDKVVPEIPAVIEGKVEKIIKRKENFIRCVVHGRMDAKALPAMQDEKLMMVITSLDKRNLDIRTGCRIAANGIIRPPDPAQLPTDFPEREYYKANNIQWFARVSAKNSAITNRPSGFNYQIRKIVNRIQSANEKLYPKEISGIVNALTTGDRSGIEYSTKEKFSRAGTAHLLAVSGLHTGIIAVFAFLLIRPIRIRCLRISIFIFVIGTFVVITGMQPSAVRAGLMALAYYLAKELQRRPEPLNILAFAMIFMIAFDPGIIYSAGFRMSVAAIFGITVLFGPFYNFWQNTIPGKGAVTKYLSGSFAATFSASVIVTPLVAHYFGLFSIISPLTNLLVVPLMSAGLIFSLFALIFFPVGGIIAELYSSASEACIRAALGINDFAVGIPGAYLEGGNLTIISIIISAGIIYFTISQNLRQSLFRGAAASIIIMLSVYLLPEERKEMKIYPRRDFVAIIIDKGETTYAALIDRMPRAYPIRDLGLERFLIDSNDKLIIGTSGNASISVSDAIKRKRNVTIVELSIKDFHYLKEKLGLEEHIPQIIDYNYERNKNIKTVNFPGR